MFGKSFRKNHPEAREGEVFLTNSDTKGFVNHIGWKSKRKGEVAYNVDNKPVNSYDFFPVFVQRSELEKGGINPDKLWRDDREISPLLIALCVGVAIVGLVLIIALFLLLN